MTTGPAFAALELTSIARGMTTLDVMVKKAPVCVLDAGVISPGKFLIVIHGDVASVEEAFLIGVEHGAAKVVDQLLLPHAHEGLLPAMTGKVILRPIDAFGIIETWSATCALRAADAAAKAADVQILELRFARHLGGKGYFTLSGAQEDVEAALEAGANLAREAGLLVARELIARPHEDFLAEVMPSATSEFRRR